MSYSSLPSEQELQIGDRQFGERVGVHPNCALEQQVLLLLQLDDPFFDCIWHHKPNDLKETSGELKPELTIV